MADFEQQAASIYDFDQDETWRAAMEFATAAAEEARQRVAARATELGIPQHFQPSLHVYWLSRGRDGLKKIRAALSTVNTQKFGTLNF